MQVYGGEGVPLDQPFLVASNHPSGLDAPVLAAALRECGVETVYTLAHISAGGNPLSRLSNAVPVFEWKGFNQKAAESVVALAMQQSSEGLPPSVAFVLFPEGQVSDSESGACV